MMEYVERLLRALRPAFTREATFAWFVVAFAGVVTRQDVYGVSSIIRALSLAPVYYPALLHFFHSTAWTAVMRQSGMAATSTAGGATWTSL